MRSHDPGQRVRINEIGVYELILSSNLPQAKEFRNFVFRVILSDLRKKLIKNEIDLHQKAISYIRKYYPDVMMNASLGENDDAKEKRIISYKTANF